MEPAGPTVLVVEDGRETADVLGELVHIGLETWTLQTRQRHAGTPRVPVCDCACFELLVLFGITDPTVPARPEPCLNPT